jgi:hypothetical protein
MDKIIPYPNQGCKGSKIHSIVDYDIFGLNFPMCECLRSVFA